MDDIVINSPEDLAKGITIPAHHTAVYLQSDGTVGAEFSHPRHYARNCDITHLNELRFPLTVKFTSHEPPAVPEQVDQDF